MPIPSLYRFDVNEWLSDAADSEQQMFSLACNSNIENRMIVSGPHGGSRPGRGPNLGRDVRQAESLLETHYLGTPSLYGEARFKRRFRMSKQMFFRIRDAIVATGAMRQGCDCTGRRGASVELQMTAALRWLAYGSSCDSLDEYLQLGESTVSAACRAFCTAVVTLYERDFLRFPTPAEVATLTATNEKLWGLPGMVGSIDCAQLGWKNCPIAWKGQYSGRSGKPTMVLQVLADNDLFIRAADFGTAGSNNDINVLQQSSLLAEFNSPTSCFTHKFVVGGQTYNRAYMLGDGIYPKEPFIVKPFAADTTAAQRHFTSVQESARKDVERTFGVLRQTWGVLSKPCLLWHKEDIVKKVKTCLILHNMRRQEHMVAVGTGSDVVAAGDTSDSSADSADDDVSDVSVEGDADCAGDAASDFSSEGESSPDVAAASAELTEEDWVGLNVRQRKELHLRLRNNLVERLWRRLDSAS
eukprot:GHVU01130243.1.p1 GENE.GHVU01130243.1~~GHVU01130243.1.p1  ORF type:complete len:470 (-),score=54.29 GHVU01130243.1:3559-4968(-)